VGGRHEFVAAADDAFGVGEPALEAAMAPARAQRMTGGEGLGVKFELLDCEQSAAQGKFRSGR
jgi:hypothetical protein